MAYIGKRPTDTFPATNAIITNLIADNAVTAVKIAENAITSRELAANTIATDNIADDAIELAKMAANSVDSDQYVDGSIDSAHLADNAITAAKLPDNVITATMIPDDLIDSNHYAAGSIDNEHLADDAVGADELATNAVVAASIVAGSITTTEIAANTIAVGNIADNAVDATKIASNSILTRHIDDNQITGDQISDDIVLSGTGAIRMPDGTTGQRPGSPAAGMFRYNTTDSKFEGYTSSWGEIGGGGTNTFTTDTYTNANSTDGGSNLTYTLSQSISDEDNLIVFIDGVFQNQAAYSVSGTTLTLADALQDSRTMVVYSVNAGVSGSNLNIDTMTGDNSDTTLALSITPVNENNTQVFIDGVYQAKSTYSTSGSTLTFSTAPPTGAAVECMTFTQTAVNTPATNSVVAASIAENAVGSSEIAANAVGSTQIAANAITAEELATNAIATLYIADNSVTSVKIAENNITAREIAQNIITVAHLADDAVELAKMAANSVDSDQYVDGSIDNAHIADDAVGVAELSATGTASSSTYLRGDNAWASISGFNADQAQTFNESGADVDFRIESDDNANMFFVDGGNDRVGIGTASPDQTVHVMKASAGSIASDSNAVLTIENSDTAVLQILCPEANNGYILMGNPNDGNADGRLRYNNSTREMSLWTAATERLTIDSAGNVGIGYNSPDRRLDVVEPSGNAYLRLASHNSSSSDCYIEFCAHTDPSLSGFVQGKMMLDGSGGSSSQKLKFYLFDGGNLLMELKSGGIYGAMNDTSDVALKENIIDLSDGTTVIKALRPRIFDWKSLEDAPTDHYGGTGTGHAGFIAQEVETVFAKGVSGEEGSKGVKAMAILAHAVKTIQELEARITALEE